MVMCFTFDAHVLFSTKGEIFKKIKMYFFELLKIKKIKCGIKTEDIVVWERILQHYTTGFKRTKKRSTYEKNIRSGNIS